MRILLYHGVRPSDDKVSPDIRKKHIPEAIFRKQIEYFARSYQPMSLSDVIDVLRDDRPLPRRGLCVTFDDGYENNATTAAPILKQYGVPAAFFVTTGFIDGTTRLWVDRFETAFSQLPKTGETDDDVRSRLKRLTPQERDAQIEELERLAGTTHVVHPLYRPMTWDHIRSLANDGFEIGAHTVTHPVLTHCSMDEARREIRDSKQRIEDELRTPCRHFAYPNGQPGDWNDAVKRIVRDMGFISCLTTIDGPTKNGDDVFELKRTTIDTGDDFVKFRLTVSGLRSTIHKLRSAIRV